MEQKSKIKVMQMAWYEPEFEGNFGTSMIELCKALRQKNYKIIFLFPKRKQWMQKIEKKGCVLIFLKTSYPFSLKSAFKLQRIIKENDIDIIHTHFGIEHLLLASFVKFFFKPNLIIVSHWRGGPKRSNRIKRQIGNIAYRLLDKYTINVHIANSTQIYKQLVTSKLFNTSKIKFLFNGTDVRKFSPRIVNQKKIDKLRKNLGIKKEEFVLLCIKNFRIPVDFDIIIESFKILKHQLMMNFKVIFVGDGPKRAYVENLVQKYDIKKHTIFVGLQKDVLDFYSISHLTIVPYEPWCMETINNSVFESLCMEKPVLGFNFGSLPEVFSEKMGVFTTPPNPNEFAKKVESIRLNYGAAKKLAQRGRIKVENNFSIDKWVDKIIQFYREAVSQ